MTKKRSSKVELMVLHKIDPKKVKDDNTYLVKLSDGPKWLVMDAMWEEGQEAVILSCFEYCALELDDSMIEAIYGPLPG